MFETIPTLDAILDAHAADLGEDDLAYRNHAYRVANICAMLSPNPPENIEKIAIAAAFHDLGIWTDKTFDYLQPSIRLVTAHLDRLGKSEWATEICEMILQHHKLSPYRGNSQWLVEPFRRADWMDVSCGLLNFGLSRNFLRELFVKWSSAGFHRRLVSLEMKHLLSHPWNPVPMMKW
ncbi:HD domain-containing protein [Planctomicrobium piriforme]|uniref:HD domain-containing protein n=1 Tax=Planctomicrobium piriforme TaxID=1576369 RepID=A0A1I3B2G2_9PLAN|nr:HD domain-containing protein [Planctomicrobium piriforme]SFH55881.1 HD domain-containing protein [Planctomicrobium piriforme]